MKRLIFLLALSAVASAAEISSPAAAGSGQPFLTTTSDGRVLMSWIEPAGEEHAVRFASLVSGKWSAPRTIVQRRDLFVNWADFPSIAVTSNGTVFAHWLQKSSEGKYSYDVRVSSSRDGGRTWSRSIVVHRDGTPTEHGFVSMVPVTADSVGVVWLDGREMKGDHGGEMTLRYARVNAAGQLARESVLDSRVCECCTTGMAMTTSGPMIAYRDRTRDEIRDISVVRWMKGRWTDPASVNADGWKIDGCPVNGPQVEARGRTVAVAWFTAAREEGRVNIAFSPDDGRTFAKPIRMDGGSPTGRVDLLLLEDGSALVAWIDGLGDAAHIALRRVWPDGRRGPIEKIVSSSTARGAGFPRMTAAGRDLFLAWTDPAPKRVRVTTHPLPR